MAKHAAALRVLRDELEGVQTNVVYLSSGLESMLSRNLSPSHPHIREAAIQRWRDKLTEQIETSRSLNDTILFLEEQPKGN